jgi:hypothetical protein
LEYNENMPIIQYVFAFFGSVVALSIVSLAWPLVTTNPRPEPLTKVREIVIQTPLGAQAAQVLGVTDESGVSPVNMNEFVTTQTSMVIQNVSKSAQNAVTTGVLTQLASKFNELPEEQKLQFQSMVCQPPIPTPSAE